jgi:hypothetical protein
MQVQERHEGRAWSRLHEAVVRPVVTLLLVVVATVLLAPAILVNWTRIQLYDSDAFTDSAVVALEDEAVRAALVREIVDEIVTVGSPELVAIRPLIEFVTSTVVDSLAFREIFRDSVDELHASMFGNQTGGGEPVALTIVDAVVVVTAYLEQAYPEVADQLPANFADSFIEIRGRDWAVRIVELGEDVTELAIALPLVMSLLYGTALVISQNRRQVLVWVGMGWVMVAVILVVGRDLARELVLGEGFTDQAVREAIWDAFTQSLVGWAALFGGFGLLLAVAANANQRVNPARQLERLFGAFTYSPESQWMKVLRAALFIIAGIIVVGQRNEVLQAGVLLAAAYLVYYGLSELIWLAGGGTPEPIERRAPTWGLPGTRRLALRAGAVAALLAAGAGGALLAYQALDTAGGSAVAEPSVTACNGHRELCDRRLNEVVFLGTHNSMSAASEPGWYFSHQLSGVPDQLEAGVRVLLLDTYYGFDTGKGIRTADRDFVGESLPSDEYSEEVVEAARRLAGVIGGVEPGDVRGSYLCHAFCELGATPLTPALGEINRFLEANPGEVLFLIIEDHISPEDTAKAFIASGLVKHVHTLTPGEPMPRLGELIERDERVLVFAENDNAGVSWYMRYDDFIQDTAFNARSPAELSCNLARGSRDNPLFALNHWLSESFPSTTSAFRINDFAFLYRRVSRCHLEREDKVNFVIVNFYGLGDAGATVDYLNGVGPRPTRG